MRSIKIKGCTGTKRVMPGPHIHVFMSLKFVYFIFQAQMRFFFNLGNHSLFRYCHCQEKIVISVSSNSHHERLHLEPSQTSKIEFFTKMGNGFWLLTMFAQELHH